jgi:peroxiredoxin
MKSVEVGQVPPSFRLPSGQGPEIGVEDYRGRRHAIVCFSKGMACPFCRQRMSQLARGLPQFHALNAEILYVTLSTPERARFYVDKFRIPFPYLCDPDYAARRTWGLDFRSHSIAWYAKTFVRGAMMSPPPNDFGDVRPSPGEFPTLLADDDLGFFILDRQGVVRFALAGSYLVDRTPRPLPGNEEIVRELRRCEEEQGRPAVR